MHRRPRAKIAHGRPSKQPKEERKCEEGERGEKEVREPRGNSTIATALLVGTALCSLGAVLLYVIADFGGISRAPFLSISRTALFLLIIAMPLTHTVASRRTFRRWKPFAGGLMFILLQGFAWALWLTAVGIALLFVYHGTHRAWTGLMTSLGTTGLVAHCLVLLSVHFFDTKLSPHKWGWRHVGHLGLSLTLVALWILLLVDSVRLPPLASVIMGTLSMVAISVAVPLTHGLAGKRKDKAYNWFQPLVGGTRFILLQMGSWTIWTLALVAACLSVYWLVSEAHEKTGYLTFTAAGIGGVLSQVLMLLSLRCFDSQISLRICQSLREPPDRSRKLEPGSKASNDQRAGQPEPDHTSGPTAGGTDRKNGPGNNDSLYFMSAFSKAEWRRVLSLCRRKLPQIVSQYLLDAATFAYVALVFLVPTLCAVATLAPFVVIWSVPLGWMYVCPTLLLYSLTYKGVPHVTGCRSWPAFRSCVRAFDSFQRYFDLRLVVQGDLLEEEQYMFAFHPHGILPVTCFWATRCSKWKRACPNITMDVMGASILYWMPVLRDVLLWSGGRDVSRASLKHALTQGTSILLVPGGQTEMRYSTPSTASMVVVTGHKGFIRYALKHGVSLVPMLSFGEDQLLANIRAPRMQALTTKLIGFGFPMYPLGRWYSPIPNNQQITVVVGDAIPLKAYRRQLDEAGDPPPELVNMIHERYYTALRKLFMEHREAAGFGDCQLVYVER